MQPPEAGAPKQPGRRLCNGHRKDGSDCEGPAVTGSDKCRMHLGRKAGEVIAESKARAMVQTYGLRRDVSPTEALLEEVQWTAGHVAWLRERVQEIESQHLPEAPPDGDDDEQVKHVGHPLVWGVTKEKIGGDDYGTTSEAVPNIWLRLYQDERTHLAKICADAIRCGIEERRVRLAEKQGELVFQVIRKILDDLGLTPEQEDRVAEVVPFRLRALASGA